MGKMASVNDPLTQVFREVAFKPFGKGQSIVDRAFILTNHLHREYQPSMIIETVRRQERQLVDCPKFIEDSDHKMIGVLRPEGRVNLNQMTVAELTLAQKWGLEVEPTGSIYFYKSG